LEILKGFTVHITNFKEGKLEGLSATGGDTLLNSFCLKRHEKGKQKNEKAGKTVDICGVCYSVRALSSYRKLSRPALQKNLYLHETILSDENVPFINRSWYRWNHHGELLTEAIIDGKPVRFNPNVFLENILKICRKNPGCNFALWTKRANILIKFFDNPKISKPRNLILVFSNGIVDRVLKKTPRYFDKVFNNVTVDKAGSRINCFTKCRDCLKCYQKSRKQSDNIIIEKAK
jgi:hypothetical protein